MEIPIEPEDGTEPEPIPEETKATFWGQIGEFFSALLLGLP